MIKQYMNIMYIIYMHQPLIVWHGAVCHGLQRKRAKTNIMLHIIYTRSTNMLT